MKRVVSLYLPSWSTDRARRRLGSAAPPADAPLILVGRDRNKRIVTAADRAAQHLGIRAGMPATQAGALVPGLEVLDADPEGDAAALDRLAGWAFKLYAPVVAADAPDGLYIDATGATHRYRGDAGMLDDMCARLRGVGIVAKAAIAPTYGAAHALARFVGPTSIIGDEMRDALAGLPVEGLRLSPDIARTLRNLGFDRIGELAAAPRSSLALRFGSDPGRRLDQVFGQLAEPIEPIILPDLIRASRAFVEPIGAPETLARYTGQLVDALCEALEGQNLGARQLDLVFSRVDNRLEAVRVGLGQPSRNARRLTRLLCDKLETVDPGFGVEAMTLTASVAEPLTYRQTTSGLGQSAKGDVADLIDILANRIGPQRLYRATPLESDVPERAVGRAAPCSSSSSSSASSPTTPTTPTAPSSSWPRPIRLLTRPEPVETVALLPDHPPVSFTWRGIRHRVKRADGPERIFGEWWKRDAELDAVRDYFQVEDERGERFWLYRAGDGETAASGAQNWFLHGVFG